MGKRDSRRTRVDLVTLIHFSAARGITGRGKYSAVAATPARLGLDER